MLLVFKLGKAVTIPGIDTTLIKLSVSSNSFLNVMSMFSGGSLSSFSILALGVGPYISSSIVVQLAAMVVPKLKELSQQGQKGRAKINRISRYFSLVVGVIQGFALIAMFENNYHILNDSSTMGYIYAILCLLAGMSITMWISDIITVYGLGNGVSIVIFIGAIGTLPLEFKTAYETFAAMNNGTLWFVLYCLMFVLIVISIVLVETAERRIPIQQSNRVLSKTKGDFSYIPLKPNSSSVTPVIFASAFMTAPAVILALFGVDTTKVSEVLSLTSVSGLIIYSILIVLFTFFYSNLQVDVDTMCENFEKNGTYVPGVRPGDETRKYVSKVLNSITCLGALFLVAICVLPNVIAMVTKMSSTAALGGTGIIISVSVALDVYKNLKTMKQNSAYDNYRGF